MKRMIPWVLTVVFWGLALWSGSGILSQQSSLSLRLDEKKAGITTQTLDLITETYHAAAYEEIGLLTATAPDTGREAEVYGILAAGDRSLITGRWLVDGSFGLDGAGECLISRAAALKLFGSERVAGLTVAVDQKEWYVRGVIRTERPMILLPADADKELLLSNLEFRFPGSGDNQTEAEQACYRYGVTGHGKTIDYSFFGALVLLFLWLPFLAALVLLKKVRRNMPATEPGVMRWGLELLFWAGMFLFLFQAVRFPSGFIPAKWSDFQFWSEKWKASVESLAVLFRSGLMKDVLLRVQFVVCLFCSGAAAVSLYYACGLILKHCGAMSAGKAGA